MLYLPQDHPLLDEKGMDKRLKTKVIAYRKLTSRDVFRRITESPDTEAHTKATDIMNKAFPAFTQAIARALGEPVPEDPINNPAQLPTSNGIGDTLSAMTQRIGTAVTDAASAVASAVIPGGR